MQINIILILYIIYTMFYYKLIKKIEIFIINYIILSKNIYIKIRLLI